MWVSEHIATEELHMQLDRITGKARPRFGRGHAYTAPRTQLAEEYIAAIWLSRIGAKWRDFDGEVRLYISYWRALAKSNPKNWEGRADLGKPDIDNVLKLVMDALNSIAFKDDAQITFIRVRKMPRVPHVAGNHLHIKIKYFNEKNELKRKDDIVK